MSKVIEYLKNTINGKNNVKNIIYYEHYETIKNELRKNDNDYFELSRLEKYVRGIIYDIRMHEKEKVPEEFLDLKTEIHKKKNSEKDKIEKDGEKLFSSFFLDVMK